MIIRLKVFEQTLSIVDTKSVPRKGSKDYLVLQFMFSSDWKDLNKLCYLQKGEVSQPIDVVNNIVKVPEWFTQQDHFYITLFGKNDNQEVPTNVVPLRLDKSNTLWEKDASEPKPSWIVKLIDLNNHPPVPGNNGYWLIWDTDSGAYVESELPQNSVQPDWNQNNETAADYVKNRPFYTGDPVETVLVEESTATFTEFNGLYSVEVPSTFEATVGETYKVYWDGAAYECACVNLNENNMPAIGNLSIIGAGSDTGEPFVMGVSNGQGIIILTADTSASHTFSISEFVQEVVKIDKKYLPDVRSDWNVNDETSLSYVKNRPFYTGEPVETVLLEEITAEFTGKNEIYVYELTNPLLLENGQTYRVSWDGTIYECIGTDFGGEIFLGNISITGAGVDTGEPFLYGSGAFGTLDTSASHTISISGFVQEIVKLDPKYIDSMYYTERGVTSIKDLEIKDIPLNGTLNSNLPLEIGQVWNAGYKNRDGYINLDWTLEVHQAEDGTLYIGTYPDVNNIPFYITTTSTKSNSGWINNVNVASLMIVGVSGTMFGEVVHKIPSKYIPTLHYIDKENPTCTGAFSLNRKNNTDIGTFSFAEGYNTTASGNYSHAEGQNTTASGFYSHSECNSTTASGNGSHAEGRNTIALGQNSHAEGYSLNQAPTTINADTSDSEIINVWKNKKFTLAKGLSSHAEGTNTLALNDSSHSEGYETTASGVYSHSEGYATTASGFHSHSEGSLTTASGYHSHSEGYDTTASGVCSHSEGSSTTASGNYSHSEGSYTYARSENQHVQGKYNIEDSSATYAHIVGNGTADNARSNAHTLDWSGNAWYAGTVEGKALILSSSTENSTKKFKITVDDSGALTATEVT